MDDMRLWPYEELKIERGRKYCEYLVSTPWLETRIDTNAHGRDLAELILSTDGNTAKSELVSCYSGLLHTLLYKPFCYILPRQVIAAGLDTHHAGPIAVDSVLQSGTFQPAWDSEAILQMSQVPGTKLHDPFTLMSIFRRFYCLDAQEYDMASRLAARFEELRGIGSLFPKAAAFLATQTWYITHKCRESLLPALPLAHTAAHRLQAFIASERGHDVLMRRAVLSITGKSHVEEHWTKPHALTIAIMKALENVAEVNFLAFAFAVSLFEWPDYSGENRFIEIFTQGGLTEAAKILSTHQAINDNYDHDRMGLDLLEYMAPVSKEYAEQAMRWSEYVARLMNDYPAALLREIDILSSPEQASCSYSS